MSVQEYPIEEQPILSCPHCKEYIIISKMNCGIFRHGTLKNTYTQIDSHATKTVCDSFVKQDLIYGCGKPFQIVFKQEEDKYEIVICDYI
jgi:hypothetical protein